MDPEPKNKQVISNKHWHVSMRLHKGWTLIAFVLIFALIGAFIAWRTFAATLVGSIEAEAMTVTSGDFQTFNEPGISGAQGKRAYTLATVTGTVTLTNSATSLVFNARGTQCVGSPAVSISIDGKAAQSASVTTTTWSPYTIPISVAAGQHTMSVTYANPFMGSRQVNCLRILFIDAFNFVNDGPTGAETLLSLGKPSAASTVENSTSFVAASAFDGSASTRWSSSFADPQWLSVDLGAQVTISRVNINWEAAYASGYQIQTSNDNVTWTTIYTTTIGDGGTDNITNLNGRGRYVRMYGTTRGTQWGYSIWEMQVYGPSPTSPSPSPVPAPSDTTKPTTAIISPLAGSTAGALATVTASAGDNVGVTKVEFYIDNVLVSTDTASPYSYAWDTTTASNASHTLASKAYDAAGNSTTSSSVTVIVSNVIPTTNASGEPYLYLGWGNPQDPVSVMSSTGIKRFTMAFMLAQNGCNPAWDGSRPLTGGNDQQKINAIKAAGGDVVVSFGGWSGNKLGPNCSDANAFAGAVQKVINAYNLKYVDFDVENTDELTNYTVQDRILNGIKIIKQNNPSVQVIVTIPTTTSGVDSAGSRLISQAKALGVNIDVYTIMTFDFGGASDMYGNTVKAADALKNKLKTTFGLTDAAAYAKVGISGMNGNSDEMEVTTPAIWTQIRDWGNANKIARLSFWAVNRDRSCPGGGVVSNCSGLSQTDLQFTRITAGFTGGR